MDDVTDVVKDDSDDDVEVDFLVISISLHTYVNPWKELPTKIKHAPKKILLPTANESMAVNDNPATTRNTPIHCGLDRERERSTLE